MRGIISILITLLLSSTFIHANDDIYRYAVNLNNVSDDQLVVELLCPTIEEKTTVFYIPKIIPGTYSTSDFGRFVSDFRAYDARGKALVVEKIDVNSWKIKKSHKLHRISYKVDDTYDFSDMGEYPIYPMSGTNIEDDNFIINTHGFFGYFKDKTKQPFEVTITKPENYYGSTGLIATESTATTDVFTTENYNLLVDAPIMYNIPDTTTLTIAGAEVLFSVYSPNGLVTSKYIANNVERLLLAQRNYLGGELPVRKYAFIMYFVEPEKSSPVQGALEHSYSSFYYLPEYPEEQVLSFILDITAHEFFHIVTPLNIHSEQIADFDFNEPEMSRHLWLYEGTTEYAAGHVQVQYDLISKEEYFKKIRRKIITSKNYYTDDLAFTEMSLKVLNEHKDEYGNVYEKGALISMCLDLIILNESNGDKSWQDIINILAEKYGKDIPFDDEELFDEIVDLTYPAVGDFFKKHVQGNEPLPLTEVLSYAGITYIEEEKYQGVSIGGGADIGFNPETYRLVIKSIDGVKEFGKSIGYQVKDELVSLNGQEIDLTRLEGFFAEATKNIKPGDNINIVIVRDGKEMTLTAPAVGIEKKREHVISMQENATEQQLRIRKAWLVAENKLPALAATALATDVESIDAIVNALYNVLSGPAGARDWGRFKSLFKPNASMTAINNSKNGNTFYRSLTANEYEQQASMVLEKMDFYEVETGRLVEGFGNIASVLSTYEIRAKQNGEAKDKGINTLQLVFDEGRWWIQNILWTNAPADKEIPKKYLNK